MSLVKRVARPARATVAMLMVGGLTAAVGCAKQSESAQRDTLTANVGNYDPPPPGIQRVRVGVPPFSVKAEGNMASGNMDVLAADQMTTLLDQTERFDVIERAQLQKLLDEQNMEGIVVPGELARQGQVRGVDYLLLGKVTNLRVKQDNSKTGFGLAQVGGLVNLGGADVKKSNQRITTEAGVDIRLVDPATGQMLVSNFSEYKRTDEASAMGVDIFGASAEADATLTIDEDDRGKILRLALDDALRKSLPKIDKFLRNRAATAAPAAAAPAATAVPAAQNPVVPANNAATEQPAGAKKFCGECGQAIVGATKFCPSCGAKVAS